MEDCPVIDIDSLNEKMTVSKSLDETRLADRPFINTARGRDVGAPDYMRVIIRDKDLYLDCLEKAKPLRDDLALETALGMYMTKLYPNQDTTE